MVSVRQELVTMQSSVVAAYVGYTRNAVALRAPCALTDFRCADAWDQHGLLMEEL